jgi:hypothetical protein
MWIGGLVRNYEGESFWREGQIDRSALFDLAGKVGRGGRWWPLRLRQVVALAVAAPSLASHLPLLPPPPPLAPPQSLPGNQSIHLIR